MKGQENKILPGKTVGKKLKNELKDFFIFGRSRKEFFVMSGYSIFLVFSIVVNDILGNFDFSLLSAYFILFLMGVFFLVSDFFKRKYLFGEITQFLLDVIFFSILIVLLVSATGGYESPLRLPLLFLTAVSAPLYTSSVYVYLYLFLVIFADAYVYSFVYGLTPLVLLHVSETSSIFAAALIIKISVEMYKKKAGEFVITKKELFKLRERTKNYNRMMQKEVKEKTRDLENALNKAKKNSLLLERQRLATMNILEDVSETQEKLHKSKESVEAKSEELKKTLEITQRDKIDLENQRVAIMNILEDQEKTQVRLEESKKSLEKRQKELESIADFSQELTKVHEISDTVIILKKYINDFLEFKVIHVAIGEIQDVELSANVSFIQNRFSKSFIKKTKSIFAEQTCLTSKKITQIQKNKLLKLNSIYKKNNSYAEKIKYNVKNEIFSPLDIGEKAFGAVYIYLSQNKENLAEEKKELIKTIISAVSIKITSIMSMQKVQQSKTESLVRSLNNGIIMYNKERKIILSNPAIKKFINVNSEKKLEVKIMELFTAEKLKELLDESIEKDKTNFIKEQKIDDRVYEVLLTPVKDFRGVILGASIIFHDVTQLKMVDKMKTEFVSVASHQLRTPLTAIKLFTEMLYNEQVGSLTIDQKKYLDNVYQSTDRMVHLVNDLLNVTRLESGRLQIVPKPVDLGEVISTIVSEAKPIATTKGIDIIFNNNFSKKINLDLNLVRQVIHNLLTNAIRYSPGKNGKIVIELRKEAKFARVDVSDNGIGIPKENQERIFEKFYRADNAIKVATEGTGLGLYVSKMIINNSGGELWFKTGKNKGTTFSFTLPLEGMKKVKGERGLAIS